MADQNQNKVLLQWETLMEQKHTRGLWRHVGVAVATLGLIAYAVFYEQSWSMAAVMGMLGIMVFLYSKEAPRTVNAIVSEAGVEFDNKFYDYKDCKSFWILEEPNYKALFLKPSKTRKLVKIPLGKTSPDKLREILQKYLPENSKGHELFVDRWARRLKL